MLLLDAGTAISGLCAGYIQRVPQEAGMTETSTDTQGRQPVREFLVHCVRMPGWQKTLLFIAVIMSAMGLAHAGFQHVYGTPAAGGDGVNPQAVSPTVAPSGGAAPTGTPPMGASGFVSTNNNTQPMPAPTGVATTPATSPSQTSSQDLLTKSMPWATRVGVSYILGFVVGWIFRAFVKIAAMITVLGALAFGGLSYFHIVNIDASKAEQQYKDVSAWMMDQSGRAKDFVMAHIPGHLFGGTGFFLGFRRKQV
jgi:uncharacterized membrane protein (Fun14 family)